LLDVTRIVVEIEGDIAGSDLAAPAAASVIARPFLGGFVPKAWIRESSRILIGILLVAAGTVLAVIGLS
jgi:hypothetical protein